MKPHIFEEHKTVPMGDATTVRRISSPVGRYNLVLNLNDDSVYVVDAEVKDPDGRWTVIMKFDCYTAAYAYQGDKEVCVGRIRQPTGDHGYMYFTPKGSFNGSKENVPLCSMLGFEYYLDAEKVFVENVLEMKTNPFSVLA